MKELPSHIIGENYKNRKLFEFASNKFSSFDKREQDTFLVGSVNLKIFLKFPKEILPESSGFFYDVVVKNLFKFYKLIDLEIEEDFFDIIKCKQIKNRCFIIENEKRQNFLCEIPTIYKHD